MTEENAQHSRENEGQGRAWLAALLLRRQSQMMPRFALALARLRALSRGQRRRLQRRAAASLAGAALLLALAGSPLLVPTAQAANITVVNGEIAVNDNGACSLIEAIINANDGAQTHDDCAAGAAGSDTIDLPANGAFTFSASYVYDYGDNALPTISSEIIIAGNNATLDLGGAALGMRLARISAGGDLTLNETTVSNGYQDDATFGGGVFRVDGGALTVADSTLSDSYSHSYGGAIFGLDGATLTITGSTLSGNSAFRGGALYGRDSTVLLQEATISANTASRSGAGVQTDGGSLTIQDSIISGNSGGDYGGGAMVDSPSVTITRSTFDDNSTGYGGGGGLRVQDGDGVTIEQSTFSNNTSTGDGAGIRWGAFGDSGAYAVTGSITNTTISGNQTTESSGGGVAVSVGALTMNNVTLSDNDAYYAGGGVAVLDDTALELNRVLISGNTSPIGAEVFVGVAALTADNHNLFGHSGLSNAQATYGFAPGASDIRATSDGSEPTALAAILSPLADNGGPTTPATQTHALVADSPALDRGPNAACTAAPVDGVDQRDVARNQDGDGAASANECDVGAYEYVPGPAVGICPAPGNELTTILGVGMGGTKKAVLKAKVNIPNAANLVALYGQLAGKDLGRLPRRVRFQYPNSTYTQFTTPTGTSAAYGGIYWYGGPLQPAASVKGLWFLNPGTPKKTPRALILYATHATTATYFDTYVVFPDGTTNMVAAAAPFAQTQTFTIPIDAPTGAADVTVQVALVDNDNDGREITVRAAAGPVQDVDVSTGPTNGNTLSLLTLTLPNVPGETSEVTIELSSSSEGDSAAIVGAAVNYACQD